MSCYVCHAALGGHSYNEFNILLRKEFWSPFGAAVFTSTLVSIYLQGQKQGRMLFSLSALKTTTVTSLLGRNMLTLYV
jgi:hypothetical protein